MTTSTRIDGWMLLVGSSAKIRPIFGNSSSYSCSESVEEATRGANHFKTVESPVAAFPHRQAGRFNEHHTAGWLAAGLYSSLRARWFSYFLKPHNWSTTGEQIRYVRRTQEAFSFWIVFGGGSNKQASRVQAEADGVLVSYAYAFSYASKSGRRRRPVCLLLVCMLLPFACIISRQGQQPTAAAASKSLIRGSTTAARTIAAVEPDPSETAAVDVVELHIHLATLALTSNLYLLCRSCRQRAKQHTKYVINRWRCDANMWLQRSRNADLFASFGGQTSQASQARGAMSKWQFQFCQNWI